MYPKIYTLVYNYIEGLEDPTDFNTDLTISSGLTAFMNLSSFVVVLIALLLIRQWIKDDIDDRKW